MPSPVLHLSTGFEATWREVVAPWLDRATREAWRTERPWAILVPSRPFAAALKRRWLAEGRGLAAVHCWTPGDARDYLLSRLQPRPRVAVREHLHLLLSAIAAQIGDAPTARAIARDPSRLLRTIDQLSAAHAAGPREALATRRSMPTEAATIAQTFLDRLSALGWTTVQQVDWQLAGTPPANAIGSLIAVGFDALHWEQWPLLRAAMGASEEAVAVLNQPRFKAEQLDQLWIGTWEQAFGSASPLESDSAGRPFAPLSERMENADADAAITTPADVLIGRNLREQADLVVARTALWLAGGDVTRLGILVPGPGPLAREISARLLESGLIHFDATGHGAPAEPGQHRWDAWLALQREQKLGALLDLQRLESADDDFTSALELAYGETLSDDLAVLAAWLHGCRRPDAQKAAAQLEAIRLLPPNGPLGAMIELVRSVLSAPAWNDQREHLEPQFAAVEPIARETISRSAFLDWLAGVSVQPSLARDPRATDPYALVQLLPHAAAEGQSWSHLLLAGLNEGHWPPSFDQPGFLGEREISELNREAMTAGTQGEGHLTARDGRLIVLGAAERRALARREFYNLVESPSRGLCVTAAMENDEDGRGLGPGDFLSHLYFTQTDAPLTEARTTQLHAASLQWLESLPRRDDTPAAQQIGAAAARARKARLDATRPFGPFEFACEQGPPEPLTIACKEWESAISSPAAVWLSRVLGVAATSDLLADDRWPLTTGTWVHAWISDGIDAKAADRLAPKPDAAQLIRRTREAALRTREAVRQAFSRAGRPLPDRWASGWANALWMTVAMAERVGAIEGWAWAATEWTLPKPTEVKLANASPLRLRGRMDLVLSHDDTFRPGARLWLFDFKTGSDKPLAPKDLAKKFAKGGGGLQLALYAMALRALGAAEVNITLLTADTPAEPQLSVADAEALADFWRGLARMQESGIFGQRGTLRPEFGHAPDMPLATLALPPDLLEEKWALTHPELTVHGD